MNPNSFKHSLSQDIQHAYDRLITVTTPVSLSHRTLKVIEGTGGKVSASDIIAYQIGWGTFLLRWYETGLRGETPEMPGEGFSSWDYVAIATHFYEKHAYDSCDEQMKVFDLVVSKILSIVECEYSKGNLDEVGVWQWCNLASGKKWPLSKWIRVNTASPYKRAATLIKRAKL